jgi:hypothetical protein
MYDTMSSNHLNKWENAAHLHIPSTSKFPLSSPISDDQISNQSFESNQTARSSDLAGSTHSLQNPFGDNESGNTSGQDEFHLEGYSKSSTYRRNASVKPRPEEPNPDSENGQDAPLARRKKPGLNLVTDFSKTTKPSRRENPTINTVPVRRPILGHDNTRTTTESQRNIKSVGLEEGFANPGFVNLNDLERLRKIKPSKTRPKARKEPKKSKTNPYAAIQEAEEKDRNAVNGKTVTGSTLRRFLQNEPMRRERDSNPLHLQPPAQEVYEVSPTARSVIFGISVPENEVEAHKPSDEASSALTLQTPITPSIVVTPADATLGWSHSAFQGSSKRAVSSVYSQVTGLSYVNDPNAPPVPSLPSYHKHNPILEPERPRHSVDTWEVSPSATVRPLSSDTFIEEDDAQQTEPMPFSATSKLEILPSSCDTSRPRSKGWWNLMLSPMLSRAGTNATKKTASPLENAPALPCLPTTTEKGFALAEQTPVDGISPETPRRAGLDNNRNSTWSNWTQWENDREQVLASRHPPERADEATSNGNPKSESDQRQQVVTEISTKKSGLAAEYYQGCAFDQLNALPYFECMNHDCANALPKLGGSTKGVMLPEAINNWRVLEVGPSIKKTTVEPSSPPGESRLRSDSDSTIIEDDPIELSPNVRKAHARPFQKVAPPQKIDAIQNKESAEKEKASMAAVAAEEPDVSASKSATPPPYSPPPLKAKIPRYVGIMPPSHQSVPYSPGPLSPDAQRSMNPGGLPMTQIHQAAPAFITFNTRYPAELPPRPIAACVSLSDIENPVEVRHKAEVRRRHQEQEDAIAYKAGGLWRGRGCFPKHGCYGRSGSAGRTRRRWYIVISTSFVLMIVLVVVLATQLTRRGDQTPVQSQWLNLTGYPPMPTGISTIAKPDMASAVTACVQPSSLWSCALPREDQAANSPSDSDQPNFRLEIRFRNGTVDANGTIPVSRLNDKRAPHPRRMVPIRRQNDPFTNALFEPNPAPPSLAEQNFIGNTTDNISFPFSGEATPFFFTFLSSDPSVPEGFNDTKQSSDRRLRRQTGSGSGSIPSPALLSDGTAAPANLLPNNPLPFSQPVMLYNRGLDTEHYGFYTYFDRSIFVKSTIQFNSSSSANSRDGDAENSNGGSLKKDADLRCTWAQTRFLVQIWTNPNFGGQLLSPTNGNGTGSSSGPANGRQEDNSNSGKSSATDFNQPGSFPYPVSVTLDRHGGDSSKKGVYCYGMDGQQRIVVSEKKLVAELREAGGTLSNAASGIFSKPGGDDGFDAKAGGIDGGTGGCGCEWRNWAGNGR